MDGARSDQHVPFKSEADVGEEDATEPCRRCRSDGAARPGACAHRRASNSPKADPKPEEPRTHALGMGRDLDMFCWQEIALRDRQLRELSQTAHRNRTEAWVAQRRAEALDRELGFLRGLRRSSC